MHKRIPQKSSPKSGEHIRLAAGSTAPKLPLGYHETRSGGRTTRLIVAPDRAHQPAGRSAGFGVTLYGLRSDRNWGCGDFRDLRDLIDWAVPALAVDFIALNPLHAIHNRRPYNTSPYLPNSTFSTATFCISMSKASKATEPSCGPGGDSNGGGLRQSPTVEYEQVAALKRKALERIFATNPPGPECLAWIAAEGELLRLYATYCALDEFLHAANPDLWIWPDWPEKYRDPTVTRPLRYVCAGKNARAILFHGWLQWLVDPAGRSLMQQHAILPHEHRALLYDLALATDGSLWCPISGPGVRSSLPAAARDGLASRRLFAQRPGLVVSSAEYGSRHRADGYRLFAESIRKTMRHGGALRIDHVMRSFPPLLDSGRAQREGGSLRSRPRAGLWSPMLALESVRNKSVIIGEDLGTVEDEVRETLKRFGILSYKLLYFERAFECNAADFRQPAEYRYRKP